MDIQPGLGERASYAHGYRDECHGHHDWFGVVSFTLDTVVKPAVIIPVITDNGDGTATITGTGEAGSVLQLFDGVVQIGLTTVPSNGIWTMLVPIELSTHQLSMTETDLAGNTATTAAPVLTVATPPPDMTAASDHGQSSTDNITNLNKPVFTGSGLQTGATVQLFDSNGTTVLGSALVDALGNWSITSSLLSDGTHNLTVKHTFNGVVSAASSPLVVTIDTVKPLAPSKPSLAAASDSGASASDNLTNVINPIFTGTADAGNLVQIFDGTTLITSITAAADGTWTTPSSISLADGIHNISATAIDVAGNTSVSSGKLSVSIDTIAPNPVISSMAGNANGSVTLSGSVEAGAIVSVIDLTAQLGTVTASTKGTWSFTTASNLSDTLHVFLTRATDAAGNASTISGQSGTAQFGSTQADLIKTTIGNDIMFGGGGADTFSFLNAFGKDVIQDFTATGVDHDVINFHNSSLNATNVLTNAKQVGTSTIITQDANNTLTLNNVSAKSLIAADFTFA